MRASKCANFVQHMNRRHFLKASATTALWLQSPAWAAAANLPPDDAELLRQARDRIERLRRSAGAVVVKNAQGRPVAGAEVRVEQQSHAFLFGCNAFMVAKLREPEHEAAYRKHFAALLNFATLGFYWGNYERERGKPNYDYTDTAVAWLRGQNITCKGHPLAWDYTPDPAWLPEDFAEIRRLSLGRVREIIQRYQGRIDTWDVVNEPTHLGRTKTRMAAWAQSLGAVPYVAAHLTEARQASATARLLVNDYRTDPPFHQILESLRRDGKLPFDAVGIQSHMHDGGWPLARIWNVCDAHADFNVPVHFTETTIVSGPRLGSGENWGPSNAEGEARQAEYVPKFYTMLFGHPAVEALTWWDFSDQGAWQRAAAGLIRRDMTPKPVYERLQALIKGEWWTRTQGRADAEGRFALNAFHGAHRVVVRTADGKETSRDMRWEKGKANAVEITA